MKLCWSIFAAYLLLLAVLGKCADRCEEQGTAAIANTNHHDADEHTGDDCPPFCVCSCCGSVNQLPALPIACTAPVTDLPPVTWGQRVCNTVKSMYHDFWQPPRYT